MIIRESGTWREAIPGSATNSVSITYATALGRQLTEKEWEMIGPKEAAPKPASSDPGQPLGLPRVIRRTGARNLHMGRERETGFSCNRSSVACTRRSE